MKELLLMNLANIIFVLALILIVYIGLQTRFKAQVAGFILEIVREAETEYGSGTGLMKKARACEMIYEMLPTIAKFIIPQKMIGIMIDMAADELTKYLENISNDAKKRLI